MSIRSFLHFYRTFTADAEAIKAAVIDHFSISDTQTDISKFIFYFQEDITSCSTCGEEGPDKKCSKCKQVQYCDRECQRLHWFMHKKTCARPMPAGGAASVSNGANSKKDIDTAELSEQLQNLIAG